MTTEGYIGRTTDRLTGATRITTSVHPTREDAARAAMAADPKARAASSEVARGGHATNTGIEWHSRWSVTPAAD